MPTKDNPYLDYRYYTHSGNGLIYRRHKRDTEQVDFLHPNVANCWISSSSIIFTESPKMTPISWRVVKFHKENGGYDYNYYVKI